MYQSHSCELLQLYVNYKIGILFHLTFLFYKNYTCDIIIFCIDFDAFISLKRRMHKTEELNHLRRRYVCLFFAHVHLLREISIEWHLNLNFLLIQLILTKAMNIYK